MNEQKINEFKEFREKLILTGKRQPLYREIGKHRGMLDTEKYGNPDSLEAGAISNLDAAFLYDFVQRKNCKRVLELGTLFGTSAYVMIMGMLDNGIEDPIVYTCDKYKLLVDMEPYRKYIKYFNMKSCDMLDEIKDERFDLVFSDAKFKRHDAGKIKRLCRPFSFITHDFDSKGAYNIKMLQKEFKNWKMKLTVHSNMAYLRQI